MADADVNQPGKQKVALPRTLAVDVGGTGIKAIILDAKGKPLTTRTKVPTPKRATPKKVIAAMEKLAKLQGDFERVSVGFPGVVHDGEMFTAPNLGRGWKGFNLAAELRHRFGCPVRVANDADVQGMGAVTGHGIELVVTLGTGFGSALFVEGRVAHLELAHHPFRGDKTYEDELGNAALKRKGAKKWNRHLREALTLLFATFNCDRLYIGGGNNRYIKGKLSPNAKIVSNVDGLLGGIKLWTNETVAAASAG